MNKKIKALMFDMDGTLIDKDSKMHPFTVKALQRLKSNGYCLVLNSGRPIHLSQYICDQYFPSDFFDYIFGCNGLECLTTSNQHYELLGSLDEKTIIDISEQFNYEEMTLLTYEGFDVLVNKLDEDPKVLKWLKDRNLKTHHVDYHESIQKAYPKVVGIFNEKYHDLIARHIQEINDPRFSIAFSSYCVLEFLPKGVNKKDACISLCEKEKIQMDEILSFGDTANDWPMLESTVGVVMENGDEDLKKRLSYTTARVDEEGIYDFLKRHDFLEIKA